MFFDDYALPAGPAGFYIGSYRPLLLVEYAFWEALIPGHFWTVVPKLTSAVYIALAATALAVYLEQLRVHRALAISAPLAVLCNPVLADATLWQSSHALALALSLVVASHVAWLGGRPWLAGGLLLAGVLGYQLYIGLAVVLLAAEIAIGRPRLPDLALHSSVVVAVGAIQIGVMLLTRLAVPQTDARGFASIDSIPQFVNQKLHGMLNLTVNGIMPVLAWYAGAIAAMSLWKWVPIGLGIVTALVTRRVVPTILVVVLLFLPSLPILAMSQSPYSWRVSAPVAFGLALALAVPLARVADVRIAVAVCVLVAAFMAPVSWYEAQSRVYGHARQEKLMEAIETRASREGSGLTIAWAVPAGRKEDPRYRGPRDLTWGYEVRTPAMWTSFGDEWMARAFVESRGGRFRLASADEIVLCARNCSHANLPSPRVMHLGRGLPTLVCAEVLPELPDTCPSSGPVTAIGRTAS